MVWSLYLTVYPFTSAQHSTSASSPFDVKEVFIGDTAAPASLASVDATCVIDRCSVVTRAASPAMEPLDPSVDFFYSKV